MPACPTCWSLAPYWLLPSIVLALLIPTIIFHRTGSHRLNAFFGFAVDGVLTIGLMLSVGMLIAALPTHQDAPQALLLPPRPRSGSPKYFGICVVVLAIGCRRAASARPAPRAYEWSVSLSADDDEPGGAQTNRSSAVVAQLCRLFISRLQCEHRLFTYRRAGIGALGLDSNDDSILALALDHRVACRAGSEYPLDKPACGRQRILLQFVNRTGLCYLYDRFTSDYACQNQ